MNELILKWLASSTIGLVVCSSLWLAGSVQHEVNLGVDAATLRQAQAAPSGSKVRLASRPLDAAASGLAVRTGVTLN